MSATLDRSAPLEGRSASSVPGRAPVRIGRGSWVRRPRLVVVGVALTLLSLVAMTLAIVLGDVDLSVATVVDVLLGGGTDLQRLVVVDLRLPRVLVGFLVGIAFGMSGAIFQTVTRNALATPDILGITFGASAAAVVVIVMGPDVTAYSASVAGVAAWLGLPLAALAGGLATAALIYALSWRDGIEGFRLILIGIAVGSMLAAVTSWLLVRAQIQDVQAASVWLTGSLNNRDWSQVVPLAIAVVIVGTLAVGLSRTIAALGLGAEPSRALGVRHQSAQLAVLAVAVVLASVATAAAGPIAFVALAAPQLAMRLSRTGTPPILVSGLAGAALVLVADLVARVVLPVELPVGVVTAALGAPYLLLLLVQGSRRVNA